MFYWIKFSFSHKIVKQTKSFIYLLLSFCKSGGKILLRGDKFMLWRRSSRLSKKEAELFVWAYDMVKRYALTFNWRPSLATVTHIQRVLFVLSTTAVAGPHVIETAASESCDVHCTDMRKQFPTYHYGMFCIVLQMLFSSSEKLHWIYFYMFERLSFFHQYL